MKDLAIAGFFYNYYLKHYVQNWVRMKLLISL